MWNLPKILLKYWSSDYEPEFWLKCARDGADVRRVAKRSGATHELWPGTGIALCRE
jgi:hypothetical protein